MNILNFSPLKSQSLNTFQNNKINYSNKNFIKFPNLAQLKKDTVSFTSNPIKQNELEEDFEWYLSILKSDEDIQTISQNKKQIFDLIEEKDLDLFDACDMFLYFDGDVDSHEEEIDRLTAVSKDTRYGFPMKDLCRLLLDENISDEEVEIFCDNDDEFCDEDLEIILDIPSGVRLLFEVAKDDYGLLESKKILDSINYDEDKLKQIKEFTNSIASSRIYYQNAKEAIDNGYTVEDVEKAVKILNNNNMYGINVIELAGFIKNYGEQEAEEIVAFAKQNNIYEFVQAISLFNIENTNPTTEDDVFPKELSKEELMEKYSGNTDWSKTIFDMYSQIRRVGKYAIKYPQNYGGKLGDLSFVSRVSEVPEVDVYYANNWLNRKLKGEKLEKIKERMSLNVVGDSRLITLLDKLMKKEQGAFSYKVPTTVKGWIRREDPVTLYFKDEISPQLKEKIAKITAPFARGRINGVEQNDPTPWLRIEKYSQGECVEELLKEAKELDNDLYKTILEEVKEEKSCSTGYYRACLKVIEEYKQYLQQQM